MLTTETFTELLGHDHVIPILELTGEPISAAEIINQTDIPQATCYRRIKDLKEAGVITEHGTERFRNGKETKKYVRTIDSLHVEFEDTSSEMNTVEADTPTPPRNDPETPPQSPSIK